MDFDLAPLQDRAVSLVEAAKKAGADAADSVVAASRSSGVDVRDGKIEETESSENNAFVLRAFVGDRSASVSANLTGAADTLAERVVAMARVSPEDPHGGLADSELLSAEILDLDLFDSNHVSFDEMRDNAMACEAAALSVKGVSKSSGAGFSQGIGGSVLATSHGFVGAYAATRFSASVSVVAGEDTAMERDYDFDSRRHRGDLRNVEEIGRVAGERAAKRVNPKRVDTQTATIVYDPRVARGLVSHLASAINGSSIARKTSFLRDDMGKQIFAQGVAIVDEPLLPRGLSSRPFDAEGVGNDDIRLIDDGVLQSWVLDSATARELGLITNGRANRAGSGTSPGTSNTTLLPGSRSPEDMIADLTTGFYVTELIGQGVNMITGDYSRGASGFWIEHGEITHAVSEVTIASNLRDMFARLEPANDLDKSFGTNAPTIAIEGMTIAGS